MPRFGIDTSILVRLVTGHPEAEFMRCEEALRRRVAEDGDEFVASNQVVGETYVVLQHHYGVSKARAREALAETLRSGYVQPESSDVVFGALGARSGAGLMDRLIAGGYAERGMKVLTMDSRMAKLDGVEAI
jgi:predicted nucleic acid-binding protein